MVEDWNEVCNQRRKKDGVQMNWRFIVTLLITIMLVGIFYQLVAQHTNFSLMGLDERKQVRVENALYEQGTVLPGKGFFLSLSIAGIDTKDIQALSVVLADHIDFREIQLNDHFLFRYNKTGNELQEFVLDTCYGNRYHLTRDGESFDFLKEKGKSNGYRLLMGTIKEDLVSSLQNEKMDKRLATEIEKFITADKNFNGKLQVGDEYKILLKHDSNTRQDSLLYVSVLGKKAGLREGYRFERKQGNRDQHSLYSPYSFRSGSMDLSRPFSAMHVVSPFGVRVDPFTGRWVRHLGVDYAAPFGSSINSVRNGIVTLSGPNGGFGNCVIIKHIDGTSTLYGHMYRTLVTAGETVSKGQIIGLVGNTGRSTGPHLHFGLMNAKGGWIDPEQASVGNDDIGFNNTYSKFLTQMGNIKRILWDLGGA